MKDKKASYLKKENKKVGKIKFEKFPGDNKAKIVNITMSKPRKIIIIILTIIILLILLIGSSFLNKKILDDKGSGNYHLVNKFNGDYANIKASDRSVLFKEIGFDVSKEENRVLNDKTYVVTYAYHKHDQKDVVYDTISVYYDDRNYVYYVSLTLSYEDVRNNLNVISNDVNNLLNNFVKIKVKENMIEELIKDGYYYDDESSIEISMALNDVTNADYDLINVTIQR